MKYIGIRGHRGSGKKTIAYLLANTIEYLLQKKSLDEYKNTFKDWCKKIIENEHILKTAENEHVIIEGFGDGPKILLYMLTGISVEQMQDDYSKDHIVFNLRTFKQGNLGDEVCEDDLISAKEYFNQLQFGEEPKVINKDIWMTLRELILYFGIYVMQNTFGLNVWVKSLIANSSYYNCLYQDDVNGYKIYPDIKARTEITYIKDHGGIIIKVSHPGHIKRGGMDLLKGDSRYDYEVINQDNLEDTADQIFDIAKKIIG